MKQIIKDENMANEEVFEACEKVYQTVTYERQIADH